MSLKNWSVTPASNSSAPPAGAPEGATLLKDINDIFRQVMADVRTLASSDTIASATTCDLGSKDATFLTVSGTTTITGLGTVSAGIYKAVVFGGTLTLTQNATSLSLPGQASIVTAAGDTALFLSRGAGNWKCMFYQRVAVAPYGSGSIAVEAVIAPTLLNSWVNNTGGWGNAGYWKDSFGVVHLQGAVKDGTPSGDPIFTLPAGYRPPHTTNFPAVNILTGALLVIQVNTIGDVLPNAAGVTISLDGITFRTT